MRIHSVHKLIHQRLEQATKPFNARGAKVKRCRYCQVAEEYCICPYQPQTDSNLAVILLMSDAEILKPSNTGRLIADVVKETYTFQWSRTEPSAELLALLSDKQYFPVVIFPEEYVEVKQRVISNLAKQSEGNKLLLIFIDASWREARKIFRKSPYLDSLPVMSVSPSALSEYQMRSSENENHLSTAEVAHLVLEQAGEQDAAEQLNDWFKVFRESYLLSKTRLKSDLSRPELQRYVSRYSKKECD